MKELLRSAKEGRSTWSKSGESTGKRSLPSRARNSGEEKKAEELEKRPPADILVLSSYCNYFSSVFFQKGHLQTPKILKSGARFRQRRVCQETSWSGLSHCESCGGIVRWGWHCDTHSAVMGKFYFRLSPCMHSQLDQFQRVARNIECQLPTRQWSTCPGF